MGIFRKDKNPKNTKIAVEKNNFQGFSRMLDRMNNYMTSGEANLSPEDRERWDKLFSVLYYESEDDFNKGKKQGVNYVEKITDSWRRFIDSNNVLPLFKEMEDIRMDLTRRGLGVGVSGEQYGNNAKIKTLMEKVEEEIAACRREAGRTEADIRRNEEERSRKDAEYDEYLDSDNEERLADLDADINDLEDERRVLSDLLNQSKNKVSNYNSFLLGLRRIIGQSDSKKLERIASKIAGYDLNDQKQLETAIKILQEKDVPVEKVQIHWKDIDRGSTGQKETERVLDPRAAARREEHRKRKAAAMSSAADTFGDASENSGTEKGTTN